MKKIYETLIKLIKIICIACRSNKKQKPDKVARGMLFKQTRYYDDIYEIQIDFQL